MTPSEAFVAEYRALCKRHGFCISLYAPDSFGAVPLDNDPFPDHVASYEEVQAEARARRRGEVRNRIDRIVALWRPRYFNSWPGRAHIEARVHADAATWPGDMQAIFAAEPELLSDRLDEAERLVEHARAEHGR